MAPRRGSAEPRLGMWAFELDSTAFSSGWKRSSRKVRAGMSSAARIPLRPCGRTSHPHSKRSTSRERAGGAIVRRDSRVPNQLLSVRDVLDQVPERRALSPTRRVDIRALRVAFDAVGQGCDVQVRLTVSSFEEPDVVDALPVLLRAEREQGDSISAPPAGRGAEPTRQIL